METVNEFKPLTVYKKHSILDAWMGSEYAYIQIKPGNVFCYHKKHLMGYLELLHGSRIFCLLCIFQKNCIDKIVSKSQKSQRLIAFIMVNTMQYPHTPENSIYHSNKRGPPPFIHSDTDHVLGHVLVHSVDKMLVTMLWL